MKKAKPKAGMKMPMRGMAEERGESAHKKPGGKLTAKKRFALLNKRI